METEKSKSSNVGLISDSKNIKKTNKKLPSIQSGEQKWGDRIFSEYEELLHEGPWGIFAEIKDNKIDNWSVYICGPTDSPFANGVFKGVLKFSPQYPIQPPVFRFTSRIFHPNVAESGEVCLEEISNAWTAYHSAWSILVTVQSLLADPNPEEPLNPMAAVYFLTNRDQYDDIVKESIEIGTIRHSHPWVNNETRKNEKDLDILTEKLSNVSLFETAKARTKKIHARKCKVEERSTEATEDRLMQVQRIAYELQIFQDNAPWGIFAEMMEDDISIWSVRISGPIGSPFEGGTFKGVLEFSEHYPYHPPTFTFISSIFHPNVGEDGQVCVDRLHFEWSPCHTVWSHLASIQFILGEPNTEEVLNENASLYFSTDRAQYDEIVKQCVLKSKE